MLALASPAGVQQSASDAQRLAPFGEIELEALRCRGAVPVEDARRAVLQNTSTALEVGGELWFKTPGGDRVCFRPTAR